MKKNTLTFLLAAALTLPTLPAGAALTVQTVDIAGKDFRGGAVSGIAMPLVQPLADPAAANINDALYIELFGTLAPPKAVKRFDVGDVEGTASQEFAVTRNDRIFTVEFETEGCGAYCEGYHQVFAFDARTGRRIRADDVLTTAGQQDVLRRLGRQKIAEYAEQVRVDTEALRAARRKKAPKDDIDDLQQRVELNTDCLARAKEPDSGASLRWYRLNPTKNALEVTAGRCSNHASMALDDVGDVTVKIPYAAIEAQLTPYGRGVLLGEGDARAGSPFGQVLRGTIGTSPVTMVLGAEDGDEVSGMYFYDRQRKKLTLNGKRRGNTLELQESVDGGETVTGRLVLAIDGLAVKGRWSDPKGARQLDASARAP